MSEPLEVRAELHKLARLLGRRAEELDYLGGVPAAELRILREQVTETLFGEQAQVLGRLAAASRVLPVGLVAQMAQRAFGPVLSARIAGLIDPDRAVELTRRLPVDFLADVAVELDPRRARDVIVRIPPRQIGLVTRELTRRREYVAMGGFVGYLPDPSIAAAVEAMDARTLLEVSLVLENKGKLADLAELLGHDRLQEMIGLAAASDLGQEALGLLDYLTPVQREAVMRMPELRDRRIA
jgi:hypothetical protein